eukprot:CAMPEP_0115086876 /NCGR_PEP_ID=MMETSP0227-20121206/22874_1 /TAXON_ID=89957 /ORGANISM="Polarella glacialis, Strain CCMP 1383" /LENGTH=809 /DNA_ID=CAMNT_0002476473 /DNA_START=82 /DNA_END=2511 /DNA_ORIENTATION=-
MVSLAPTPARAGHRPAPSDASGVLLSSVNLGAALGLLQRLPEHLQKQAQQDFARRLRPEIQAWLEHWDTDDGALEPEEPLSDEDDTAGAEPEVAGGAKKKSRKAPPTPSDGYPADLWPAGVRQGKEGFNAHAKAALEAMLKGGRREWKPPSQGSLALLHQQQVVASLLHPASPVQRLLCDHNTGSGKTLVMVRIMDNYYFDKRAKLAIFPKDTVVDNFYAALWEWPSRWRDYCCLKNPDVAVIAADGKEWRAARHERWPLLVNSQLKRQADTRRLTLQQAIKEVLVKTMRETLEMKRAFFCGHVRQAFLEDFWSSFPEDDVHPPAAPLRAYRFTSAGGRAAEVVDGEPRGCIFKVGFDHKDKNPYTGKVVLMDEGHHLTRPNRLYAEQLNNLKLYVETARNSVFVSCTGSMAEDSADDPRKLLDVVKGEANKGLSDEGFLSSHNKRGPSFPRQLPTQCADGAFAKSIEAKLVQRVELRSHALVRYLYQAIKLQREGKSDETLANYTNLHVYFGSVGIQACQTAIMRGRNYCPKFTAVVSSVVEAASKSQKCLVMVARKTGYKALLMLLQQAADQHGFGIAELGQMADFNQRSNDRGQRYMVMLVEAERGGESIEFKNVRRELLVDVPPRFGDYKQRCGRVVRCGSHDDLPEAERDVKFTLFAAELPAYARSEIGAFALWALCGFWGGPKKVVHASEPAPEDIEAAAQEFIKVVASSGITQLRMLHWALQIHYQSLGAALLADVCCDGNPKLRKRLFDGLTSLASSMPCPQAPVSTTIDDRLLEQLRHQAETLAPAVAQIRCVAVDAGFY